VLEHKKAFVHANGATYRITRAGERQVEARRLLDAQV
jgi:uncharacterized protein YjhX (UPF0386 family)